MTSKKIRVLVKKSAAVAYPEPIRVRVKHTTLKITTVAYPYKKNPA